MASSLLGTSTFSASLLLLFSAHVSAQSIPSLLPGNWSSVGCYTDISTSRTLAATFTSSDNMTVESCISFCDGGGYNYAGVEFGRECYCDSTIQIPGQPTALSDCNFSCNGNTSESCGSSGRLNLLYNGKQGPTLVQSVVNANGGTWGYQGCFIDATNQRTLAAPVNIPGGVTAESCTAACQSLGGYTYAGMEIGHECWCDTTVNPPAQRVSDNDCRMVCAADHTEYCGNTNRVAVYRLLSGGGGGGDGGPQECLEGDVANFTMVARYRDPGSGGDPETVKLKVVVAEMVPGVVWGVLSACPTCCTEWPYFSLQNSVVFPRSPSNPSLHASSTAPGDGETPNFVSSNPAFPGTQAYCTMEDTSTNAAGSSPPLLAFGGKADAFSLCGNVTANGRLDVVFSPVTGHPHYVLESCRPVSIQVIQGS